MSGGVLQRRRSSGFGKDTSTRKRKMASTSCKVEPATVPPENKAPADHLRDIKNIVLKNKSGLFSSNIFCDEALDAMREKIESTSHNDLAVRQIFTASPATKKKADSEKDSAKDAAKNAAKDAVVLGDSSDEECSILSKPGVMETSLDCSPRSPGQVSPIKHSRKTRQILKKLESLAKLDDEPLWCLSDDSSDLFCLDDDVPSGQERDLALMVQSPSRVLKFTIAPSAQFGDIFAQLAKEFDVAPSQIILTWKEGPIQAEDTPSLLGITPADILECIVRKCAPAKPVAPVHKKNAMTVKFQCSNKRMTESIEVSKDEPLLEGAQAFAEKASLELSKLVLKFDGDKVDPRMTPDQLGIEDGDCVDVSVRS